VATADSSLELTVGSSSMENLVAAVSAFLTAGSSLQKRELLPTMRRFELGMHV
jgi:hypothetical protein